VVSFVFFCFFGVFGLGGWVFLGVGFGGFGVTTFLLILEDVFMEWMPRPFSFASPGTPV